MTGLGGSSEPLQAGFTQKAFSALVAQYPDEHAVRQYIEKIAASVAPFMANATYDALAYPLDRLSNGNALLALHRTEGNGTYDIAAEALRKSIDLNRRNNESGLWYYTYPYWSYLDGMYSLAPFYTLYTLDEADQHGDGYNESALNEMTHQLELMWEHCLNSSSGLLVHGYDDSKTAVWANPITGASPHVRGRSLGWFSMALVDTLEILPQSPCEHRRRLLQMFQSLATAVVAAVDLTTGGWWQILDQPGRAGNYVESSGSAMFSYSLLKGSRLGYLADDTEAPNIGARAHGYLTETFVVENSNGTLGYNGTVAVCSLNSNASYEVRDGLLRKWLMVRTNN